MSKMMIVAATSEKMLELMDKITIEEGVISFLASNKATAKGYPCMFSVEGKTTTASVKFEAKIKGLDEKGEMMPVEKISVYLPARFAGKAGDTAFPKTSYSDPGRLRGRTDQGEKSENGCI